ncbi:LPXTG cell wall anchor domain-containing protein [Sporosarcina ureilytica]|nr:LPXTG cell wall anchor domain-containing protein [Sporosarcina ureilytica]
MSTYETKDSYFFIFDSHFLMIAGIILVIIVLFLYLGKRK